MVDKTNSDRAQIAALSEHERTKASRMRSQINGVKTVRFGYGTKEVTFSVKILTED